MFDFVWFFSRIGWRWPIQDTDSLEVWQGLTLVSDLPGWLVRAELTHLLSGVALQGALAERVVRERLRRPLAHMPVLSPSRPLEDSPKRLVGAQTRRLRGLRGR